jgi:hypothetical protein
MAEHKKQQHYQHYVLFLFIFLLFFSLESFKEKAGEL